MSRVFLHKTLMGILWVCLFLSACLPEAPVAEPTVIPVPSATPIPTATVNWFPATATKPKPSPTPFPEEATPQTANRGKILIEDDFSNDSFWEVQNNSDAKVNYEPNALSMVIVGEKAEAFSLSQHILPSNFYLTFTIETSICSDNDQYGIVFWRNSKSGTFRFWANCQGQLMVDRVLPDGTTRLVNWQSARKFVPGTPSSNVFSILAQDGKLDFFINETYQFSLQVKPDLEGALGIMARTAGSTDLSVRFSDLIISEPAP